MNVYFRDSKHNKRIIGTANSKEDVYEIITEFLKEHNYKSYYTRVWYDDEYTWFDVGSWTEYFLVDEDIMEELSHEQEKKKFNAHSTEKERKGLYYRPE